MPPALPCPAPRTARLAPCLACALAAAVAAPALALELTVAQPREREGRVVVEARPAQVLERRVSESLSRGMPATLVLHAELWRRRSGWFDKLESSADASVRIRYEVWSDAFLIERIGVPPIAVGAVDSVATVLERPWVIAVGRVGQLNTTSRYYLVLTATLRPLTIEDLEEVEGWATGEAREVKKIPQSLFDAVRNLAGFGDQKARARSSEFRLRNLFPEP